MQTTAVILKPLQTFPPSLLFIYLFMSTPYIPQSLVNQVCDYPTAKFEHSVDARRGKEGQMADIHYSLPPSFWVSLPNWPV